MATVASIVVNLTASTSQFERALGGAQRTMQGFVKKTKTVTRQLDDIASYGKKAGLGLAVLVGSATGLNKLAANHEENMLRVKAVTRATVAEYEAMSKAAIDLSSTTVYSLSQIADGMKFLGMAGFNATEVMKMMPTVTRLATVGALEMGEAADIATNILAGYQLGIEDLGWATDVLSSAMTGANVDLRDLGEAFKHAGPVAQGAGMEFETTAAAIALLGNAGIQGSIAGTSLKSAISRLLSPSKSAERTLRKLKVETKDTTGKMRAFDDIIEDLGKSGASTANILSIFGLRAGPSMARLVNMGSDAFREYTKRLKESQGIAALIEKEQLQSFNAQFKILKNQVRGFGVEIGQKLLPYAKTLNYAASKLIGKFRGMSDEQQMSIIRVGALGTALLGLITVFGVVAGAISLFIKGLAMMATVIALVTSPIILALVGISIGVSLMATAWKENWGGIQDKTKNVLDKLKEYLWSFYTWWEGTPVEKHGFTSGFEEEQLGFKHTLLAMKDSIISGFQEVWNWLTNTTWEEKVNDMKALFSEGWKWVLAKSGDAWKWLEGTKLVQALKLRQAELKTWWEGTPVEKHGFTSGFEEEQLGFKHRLTSIKDSIIGGLQDIWSWLTDKNWEEKFEDMKGWLREGWKWTLVRVGDAWKWLEGTKLVQALKLRQAELKTWWEGTPVEKHGFTSGFEEEQLGFKHKLMSFKNKTIYFFEDLWEEIGQRWEDFVSGVIWDDYELTIPDALVSIGLATLASVLAWNVLPVALGGLGVAIAKAISALEAGGLALGAISVASLTLALLAGAIGWSFGGKEGRDAFIDAIRKSIENMTIEEPITIPIGVMDILKATFDMGTGGLENLRSELDKLREYVDQWDPTLEGFEWPEWLSDIGRGFLELGMAMSEFMVEGFWLVFDLGDIVIDAIDAALTKMFQPAFDFGKALGRRIMEGIGLKVPEWLKEEPRVVEPLVDYEDNLKAAVDFIKSNYLVEDWERMAEVVVDTHDVLKSDVLRALGLTDGDFISLIKQISSSLEFDNIRNKLAEWNVELDDFLIKLAMSESDLEDITNSIGARGEFQMMPSSMRDVEKFLGYALDWDDATERAYGSIVFFRMGVESEFATIEAAANRLGVTLDEALKLWWVAGGGNLRNLNSLNTIAWTEPSGQIVTYQNILDAWRNIQEFSSGTPFTGWGPLDEVAGLVHKQEAVIPWAVLKKGGLAVLEFLGMPGFQDGRVPKITGLDAAKSTVETMQEMFDHLAKVILAGIAKLFDMIAVAIESLAIVFLGDEKVEELQEVFAKFRKGLEDFTIDVADFFGFQKDKPEKPEREPTWFNKMTETIAEWSEFIKFLALDFGNQAWTWLEDSAPGLADFLRGLGDAAVFVSEKLNVAGHAQQFLNSLLGQINPVAQFFSSLLQQLTPAIQTLMVPVALVAEVFATLLLPVLKLLFPPLKMLGIVMITVAQMIAAVWNALLDLISLLPFVNLKKYKINMDDLSDSKKNLKEMTWETAESMNQLNESVNEALRNVPSGLKIVANRLSAVGYTNMPMASVAGVEGVGRNAESRGATDTTIVVRIEGNVYGVDDLDRRIKRGIADATRSSSLATYGV